MDRIPHRIRSQRLIVTASTQEHAFAIREHLRREWESHLLPAMERAFDEADIPGRTIRCSRLEIALRVEQREELASLLPELLERALAERLRETIEHGRQGHGIDGEFHEIPTGADARDILLRYLRTGLLPWSASVADAGIPELLHDLCRRECAGIAELLRGGMVAPDELHPFLFRVLQLLNEDDARRFIHALLPGIKGRGTVEAARIAEMVAGSVTVPSIRCNRLRSAAASLAERLIAPLSEADAPAVKPAHDASRGGARSDEKSIAGALRLVERLIAGDAPGSLGSLPDDLPDRWRASLARGIARDDSPSGMRAWLLHLASDLLAGWSSGSDLSADEAARSLLRIMKQLSDEERSGFIDALLARIDRRWRDGLAPLLDLLDGHGTAGDERMRCLAMLVVEGLRGTSWGSPPEFASICRAALGDVALAALHRQLPSSAAFLLDGIAPPGSGAPAGTASEGDAGSRDDAREQGTDPPSLRFDGGSAPSAPPDEPVFPIAVHNAGLVLLHSFIVPFLGNGGVLDAGSRELSPEALPRAAALLHFLATGRDEPYEFELGLCKLLLGRDIREPLLVAGGMIFAEDAEECELLLGTIIGYWTALKNTSAEGFRASFLQRRGLLRREERGWRLQVEPASFDLLLNQLPWGISIIRLPWMSEPIHVEWER